MVKIGLWTTRNGNNPYKIRTQSRSFTVQDQEYSYPNELVDPFYLNYGAKCCRYFTTKRKKKSPQDEFHLYIHKYQNKTQKKQQIVLRL